MQRVREVRPEASTAAARVRSDQLRQSAVRSDELRTGQRGEHSVANLVLLDAQRVSHAIVCQVGHRAVDVVRPDSDGPGNRDCEAQAAGGILPAAVWAERHHARLAPPEVQAEAPEAVRPRVLQRVQELDVRRLRRRNASANRRQVEKPKVFRLLG